MIKWLAYIIRNQEYFFLEPNGQQHTIYNVKFSCNEWTNITNKLNTIVLTWPCARETPTKTAACSRWQCMDQENNSVWIKTTIPDDWRRGIVLLVWKNKGNNEVCSNHSGTTRKAVCNHSLECIRPTFHNTAAVNKLASLPDEVQSNTFSQFDKSSTNRRNLINNSTYIAFIDFKAALTQCPVIPCGKFFKYVAFNRNFLFLCVNCTQTPAARSASLPLC